MVIPFSRGYTITERSADWSSGRPSVGTGTSRTIQATVTPVDPRQADLLARGGVVGARFRVRTTEDLGDLGDSSPETVTTITVDGREYRLVSFGRWTPVEFGSLAHRSYVAVEVRE